VTLSTLAADLGVSLTTVSNAYNRPDQLSAGLREAILARAHELGFAGPDPAGRSLRQGRAGAVGVLLGNPLSFAFSDPASVLLLDGVASVLQRDGFSLLLVPATGARAGDERLVGQAVVDAWLAYALPGKSEILDVALARKQPVVVLDQPDDAGLPVFAPDDAAGLRMVTEHLLALGHRDLGVVTTEFAPDGRHGPAGPARQALRVFSNTARRLDGLRSAVRAADIGWQRVAVVEAERNDQEAGAAAANALLARRHPPSAIVAFTDQLALGVLYAARAAGLAVPGDLSVTGFDDVPAARFAEPPLTTVGQQLTERGAAAASAILTWLGTGVPPGPPAPSATSLIARESTGPVRVHPRFP
jgi:DNA-binding LacI/PurR family transcriptional regulator